MERLRSRASSSPTRWKARAHPRGSTNEVPKASAMSRPRVVNMAVLTVVVVLGCIVGHHLWYQNQLLRQAGPVGYHLLNGRRWVMDASVASGAGRRALQTLEALPLAAEFHDAPLFWGWPHSGGLSAEQAASENRAAAAAAAAGLREDGGMTKKKPLYAWGQRCWQPGLDHVLVAVPYNPGMVEALQQRLADTLSRLECGSRGTVNLELALDSRRPPDDPSDVTGRGRIATVRNYLMQSFLLPRHRYVLWLDADLTVVPDDLVSRLHAACDYHDGPQDNHGIHLPLVKGKEGRKDERDVRALAPAPGRHLGCVAAPLVLLDTGAAVSESLAKEAGSQDKDEVEDSVRFGGAAATHAELLASQPNSALRFYDTAAFVQEGEKVQVTTLPGKAVCKHRNYGSVHAFPPYFNFSTPVMQAAYAFDRAQSLSNARQERARFDEDQNKYRQCKASQVAAGRDVAPCVPLRPPKKLPRVVRPSSSSGRQDPSSAEADGAVGSIGNSGGATRSPLRSYRSSISTSSPSYFSSSSVDPPLLGVRVVPCDSVGTTYLLPAAVYRWNSSSGFIHQVGGEYSRRSSSQAGVSLRHYAHVLTEHYPVVHAAKYLLGVEVVTVPSVVVMHADLPMYGEGFHGQSFDRSRWPDLEGADSGRKFGLSGHRLGESAIVAKTIVELAFRNQRAPAPSSSRTSDGHDTRRGSSISTSGRGAASLSGAESNHAAVAFCLEEVLVAAGLSRPAAEQQHLASSQGSSVSGGRSAAARVLDALTRGVRGCPAI